MPWLLDAGFLVWRLKQSLIFTESGRFAKYARQNIDNFGMIADVMQGRTMVDKLMQLSDGHLTLIRRFLASFHSLAPASEKLDFRSFNFSMNHISDVLKRCCNLISCQNLVDRNVPKLHVLLNRFLRNI